MAGFLKNVGGVVSPWGQGRSHIGFEPTQPDGQTPSTSAGPVSPACQPSGCEPATATLAAPRPLAPRKTPQDTCLVRPLPPVVAAAAPGVLQLPDIILPGPEFFHDDPMDYIDAAPLWPELEDFLAGPPAQVDALLDDDAFQVQADAFLNSPGHEMPVIDVDHPQSPGGPIIYIDSD